MKKRFILLTVILLFLMTFISYSEENGVNNIGKFKPKHILYVDNKVNANDYYFDEETESDFKSFIKEKTQNDNFTIISKTPFEITIKQNENKYLIKLDLPDYYYFDNFYGKNDDNDFIRPSILELINQYLEFEWGTSSPIAKGIISVTTETNKDVEIPFYYPNAYSYDTYNMYYIKTLNTKLCNPLTIDDFTNKTSKIEQLKNIYAEENRVKYHYVLDHVKYGSNLEYQFGEFYGFYKKEGEEEGRWYKLKGVTEKNCEEEKKNEPNPKNEEVDNKITPSNIEKKVVNSNLKNKTTPSNIINKVTNSNITQDNKQNNTNQKQQTNYSQVKQNITQDNENTVVNDLNKKELSNEEKNKIENKINDVNKERDIKTSDNLLGILFFIFSLIAMTSSYLFVNYKKIKNK